MMALLTCIPARLGSRLAAMRTSIDRLRDEAGSRGPSLEGERGTAALEFALVMPVAMLLFMGVLQFGVAVNNTLELQNATSLAAQYLSVNRGTAAAADPCSLTVTAFRSVAPFLNSSNAKFSFIFTTQSGTVGTYTNVTTCTGGAAEITQGATAQVTVNYLCSLVMFDTNVAPGCNLQAQITEVIQ